MDFLSIGGKAIPVHFLRNDLITIDGQYSVKKTGNLKKEDFRLKYAMVLHFLQIILYIPLFLEAAIWPMLVTFTLYTTWFVFRVTLAHFQTVR